MANAKPIKIVAGKLKQLASTDTVPTNNLATGTANSTTFLRGDQTWATPSGGGLSRGQIILQQREIVLY